MQLIIKEYIAVKKSLKVSSRKVGFTLAEVLITLGIIGVVASLTIPTLLNKAFEMEAVSKAKETYSMLAQAVLQWQMDGNCVGDSARCPEVGTDVWSMAHNDEGVAIAIVKHLKVVDALYEHKATGASPALDWVPKVAYSIGGNAWAPTSAGFNNPIPIIVYNGGVIWGNMFLLANGVVLKISGSWWHHQLTFDINGVKGPNRIGKDQFTADLYNDLTKTITPYYRASSYQSSDSFAPCAADNNCNADDGNSPLAYVLVHNKLPDLKAMGYPASP